MKKLYYIKPVIIALIIVFIYSFGAAKLELTEYASLKIGDFITRLKYKIKPSPKEASDIALIAIDSRAYDWFDRKWPWPRMAYANLIYRLAESKPRILALNLAFIGKSKQEAEDDLLAEVFKETGNVYIATYYDLDGYYHPPEEKIAAAAKGFGSSNKPGDIDSVIRKTRLFTATPSGIIINYSFEFLIACDYLGIPVDDIEFKNDKLILSPPNKEQYTIPVKSNGRTILNYEVRRSDLIVIPILDVLQDRAPLEMLKDKIVIVGMTGKIFGDIHQTPLGPMAGAEIVANNILMLLDRKFITETSPLVNLAALLFFAIIFSILCYKASFRKGFFYLALLIFLFLLISLFLVMHDFTWDFLSIPITLFALFILLDADKIAQHISENYNLKKKVLRDNVTKLANNNYMQARLQFDMGRAILKNKNLSLVLFSINNYQSLKSKLSNEEADKLLRKIAKYIRKNSRRTRNIDFIARYKENIFCSVLRKTTKESATGYAKRVQKNAANNSFIKGKDIKISLNIGVATYPIIQAKIATELIDHAESQLNISS